MIRPLVTDSTYTPTEPDTWDSGETTPSTAEAKRRGLTGPSLKANTSTGRNTDTALTSGSTDPVSPVDGWIIRLMGQASTRGQMDVNSVARGKTIICMEEESTPGQTEDVMKASIQMIRNMVLALTPGQMAVNTQANGKTANSTARVSTNMPTAK